MVSRASSARFGHVGQHHVVAPDVPQRALAICRQGLADVDVFEAPNGLQVLKGDELVLVGAQGGGQLRVELERGVGGGTDELLIADLGKFGTSQRAAKTGRNPKTGETIQIAARRVPRFAPSKALKDAAA